MSEKSIKKSNDNWLIRKPRKKPSKTHWRVTFGNQEKEKNFEKKT